MIDWEEKVGAPCVAVFETDTASYIPVNGDPYDVTGVFDDQFRATVVEDGTAPTTTDSLPVFGVNRAQFQAEPQQGDQIQMPISNRPQSGKLYIVIEPRPDRKGIYHLALNQMGAP